MASGPSWRRTHTCGELRKAHVGQTVVLNGWVHARRDHGGIYFLDLRDRYGLTQVVIDERLAGSIKLAPEFVISVRGVVSAREGAQINSERPTGEIEVLAQSIEVLSTSPLPPIDISGATETALETRLKYRYIDLRRPQMQRNLAHRSRFINAMRRAFERQGFLEIETPILTKATPEGARDFLVPSRVHPGEFYALPQSPQIFKQILMVAGLDRYFQVARCFRDEDLRADRQLEFTQLDMELAFVEEEDVFATWEQVMRDTFKEALGIELPIPFPRMRWEEAMERFGVDKPDLRFGLELHAVDAWARASEFQVFRSAVEAGGRVMGIAVPAQYSLSRKDITELETVAKGIGAKGLAWWKAGATGGSGPLAKFCASPQAAQSLMSTMGAAEGDTCLFIADRTSLTRKVLGELRNQLGRRLGLIPKLSSTTDAAQWRFTWVTHFPLFEWDEDAQRFFSAHHPFTAPEDWSLGGALDGATPDLGSLSSRAYDLVLNGWELGSGSVRIHRADVQQKIFSLLGIGPEEQKRKFGFFVEALSYGAPPHAGFAMGLDRITALTLGLDNIREVIAFPKTASAVDLMCGAPSLVDLEQLIEVHVRSVLPEPKPGAAPA
ncbi:MAG: aspartate--tRNA ligase [Planctomycetes bacterium]|nr:aspartate--tRNA ligase [Planctomycetota bacterium]